MAKVIEDKIIYENGSAYRVKEYDTGARIKYVVQDDGTPFSEPKPEMDEITTAILEASANVEYLTALAELSS